MRNLWSSSVCTYTLPRVLLILTTNVSRPSLPVTGSCRGPLRSLHAPSFHLRPVFQFRGCLAGAASSRVRRGRYTIATAKSTNISFVTTASRRCLRDRKSRSQEACGDDMGSVWHPSVERTYSPPRILLLLTANSSRLSLPALVSPLVFLHRSYITTESLHGTASLELERTYVFTPRAAWAAHPPLLTTLLSRVSLLVSCARFSPRLTPFPASIHGIPSRLRTPLFLAPRSSLIPPRPSTPTSSLHSFR
jgi:hypothetical protein